MASNRRRERENEMTPKRAAPYQRKINCYVFLYILVHNEYEIRFDFNFWTPFCCSTELRSWRSNGEPSKDEHCIQTQCELYYAKLRSTWNLSYRTKSRISITIKRSNCRLYELSRKWNIANHHLGFRLKLPSIRYILLRRKQNLTKLITNEFGRTSFYCAIQALKLDLLHTLIFSFQNS